MVGTLATHGTVTMGGLLPDPREPVPPHIAPLLISAAETLVVLEAGRRAISDLGSVVESLRRSAEALEAYLTAQTNPPVGLKQEATKALAEMKNLLALLERARELHSTQQSSAIEQYRGLNREFGKNIEAVIARTHQALSDPAMTQPAREAISALGSQLAHHQRRSEVSSGDSAKPFHSLRALMATALLLDALVERLQTLAASSPDLSAALERPLAEAADAKTTLLRQLPAAPSMDVLNMVSEARERAEALGRSLDAVLPPAAKRTVESSHAASTTIAPTPTASLGG